MQNGSYISEFMGYKGHDYYSKENYITMLISYIIHVLKISMKWSLAEGKYGDILVI